MKKFYRKDWVLYEEVANEGGHLPNELVKVNFKTDNPDTNKHVPFIEETTQGYLVKCGKTGFHSETLEHHTIFIDLVVDKKYHYRQYISYDEQPQANFEVPKGENVVAYAFCNLHGLWTYQFKKS